MFQNPRTRQMTEPKMFRKKFFSDELVLHSSSKVQNLTVFSIFTCFEFDFSGRENQFRDIFGAHGKLWATTSAVWKLFTDD